MLFASDLDNTMIHSYKTAKKGDICVELKDGKELSFMSPEAYSLLKTVASECLFVPITTRSLEQYRRITLGVKPEYALAAHGALLLVNGEVDRQWACETRAMLGDGLPAIKECDLLFDIRYADEFFIFAKSENPDSAVEYLKTVIDVNQFFICSVHNKVYVFPKGLDKGTALARLKKRLQPKMVACAGDSVLDIPMLEVSDIAIAPKALAHKLAFAEEPLKRVFLYDFEEFAFNVLCTVNKILPTVQ
ncbi:MAG: HAD hydrolase family protein [Oscillospiraceae bacterium]|nr:HAD hydrolase family protein [Oscillospiraceae bacterium]